VNDSGYADFMSQVSKWVRESCDAEDEDSEAFVDLIITGYGWTETRMDYETNPKGEGDIKIDRIDPLEMLVDPDSKKGNCVDARWVAHIKEMTKREFEEKFPGEEFVGSRFWNSDLDKEPHDAQNAWKYENDQSDKLSKHKTTWVAQYQYYERKPFYKVLSPDGNMLEFPEDRFAVMKEQLDLMGVKYIKYLKRVYKECFINNKKILSERDLGCDHFTFQSMTGLRDRNNSWFTGLVELMKDPQRWANKWLSQIQHILNTSAKSGYLAETGAFKNKRDAETALSTPGSIIELNTGGLAKLQQMEAPRYPEGIDRLLQYALQSINDVPGVNLELIGMANRDQAIGLEESRKQAGVTILAVFFDSLRRYRKIQGRVLAYFIREYISDGRLARIVGEEGAKNVPLMKDKLAFDYDVVVDDAPTSPNMKERIYPVLNQTIGMALQAGIPVPPDVLDFAPLPDNLIQKWKSNIMSAQKDPTKDQMKQMQMMDMQLELQKKQAEVQKITSDVTYNYARAEQAHATSQDESAQAMQKMGMSQMEHQMKYEQMLKDQGRKDIEMALNQHRKMLEAQMNAKIKAETARYNQTNRGN
jgi:hypothetical protein